MEEIFEQFKDKDAFDAYWKEHYVPLTYEDVREAYEDFVKSADKHIFLSDYEESGNVSREDFMDNLSQAAQFAIPHIVHQTVPTKNHGTNADTLHEKLPQYSHPRLPSVPPQIMQMHSHKPADSSHKTLPSIHPETRTAPPVKDCP